MDFRNKPRRTTNTPIAQARINAGLTQQQLAEKIGVSQKMISAWEAGYRNPKLETVRKLADALGIDWLALIDR